MKINGRYNVCTQDCRKIYNDKYVLEKRMGYINLRINVAMLFI